MAIRNSKTPREKRNLLKLMGAVLAGLVILSFMNVSCDSCKRSSPKPGEKPKQQLFSITPADGETIRHLNQPIFVSFPQPVQSSDFTFKIEPDPGGWEVIWDKSQKRVRLEHKNPFTTSQNYRIKLLTKGGTFESHFKTLPPDPGELLASDLARGVITPDEAAQYHIMRIFNPKVVPEKYRYTKAPRSGTWDVLQAANLRNKLKPETVGALEPYMVRPDNPKSIYYKRLLGAGQSSSKTAPLLITMAYAAEPAKEVYHTDTGYTIEIYGDPGLAELVRKARRLIEEYKIYEKFERLLNRKTSDFGDKTLKIYLFPYLREMEDAGKKFEPMGFCEPIGWDPGDPVLNTGLGTATTWIAISVRQVSSDPDLVSTLAHEMFHSFQFAFSKYEQKWLVEGSAVWAEDFIGRDWNTEQVWLPGDTFNAGDASHNQIIERASDNAYGMYLFFYYLTRIGSGGDAIMRRIWENCAGNRTKTFESVRAALPGELSEVLKEYALFTLDVEQYKGKFPDAVGAYGGESPLDLSGYHKFNDNGKINADGNIEIGKPFFLTGMSIAYVKVENKATGVTAPAIKFDLKEFLKNKAIGIQAVIKYRNGRQEMEDWTGREERIFCLAKKSQNFETLYLVFSWAEEFTGRPESYFLEIEPAAKEECMRGQMRITLTVLGQEESESKTESPGRNSASNSNKSWNRQVSFLLQLTPEPVLREMVPQVETPLRKVPDHVREKFLAEVSKPKMRFDEHTQCREYIYRVHSVSVDGPSGTLNLSRNSISNDTFGLTGKSEIKLRETWTSQGLDEKTEQWLKKKNLRVRVFIDPKSNQIKWVNPEGHIAAKCAISQNSQTDGIQRKGHPPNLYYEPYTHSEQKTRNFVWQVQYLSESVGNLPSPDWQAKEVWETGAKGGGKKEHPLDHDGRGDTPSGYSVTRIRGKETKKIEWELELDSAPAP
jgi:hypothetical protein